MHFADGERLFTALVILFQLPGGYVSSYGRLLLLELGVFSTGSSGNAVAGIAAAGVSAGIASLAGIADTEVTEVEEDEGVV